MDATHNAFPVEALPIHRARVNRVGKSAKLHSAIINQTVSHDGNPALARHITNAVVKETSEGAYITKEHRGSTRKIDLATAAIIARDLATDHKPHQSVYETRGCSSSERCAYTADIAADSSVCGRARGGTQQLCPRSDNTRELRCRRALRTHGESGRRMPGVPIGRSGVDEHVEGPVERWVRSACVLCSHGCGLEIGVRDGRIVGVRGADGDRVNHGRLGPKGLYGWQANKAADRLLHPLVRRDGELREASWDEAMDLVVERSRELLATKGSGALGFYTSGQLFIEDYYTLALVARGGIGTNHLDGNTRLCTATAGAGAEGDVRLRRPAGRRPRPRVLRHDPARRASTRPRRRRCSGCTSSTGCTGPNPPRSIVIDPRETPVGARGRRASRDPAGTNLALLNGLAQQLIENDLVDRDFVDGAHRRDRGAREDRGAGTRRERVAEICACRRERRPSGGGDPRRGREPADVRAAGRLPVPPGDGGGCARRTTSTCCGG